MRELGVLSVSGVLIIEWEADLRVLLGIVSVVKLTQGG